MPELTLDIHFTAPNGEQHHGGFSREGAPGSSARYDAQRARAMLAELYREASDWLDGHVGRYPREVRE